MKSRVMLFLLALATLMLAAAPAMAGAFRIPESSAAAMGQGNAFVGQADEPSAVQYNPAAITGLEGVQIQAGMLRIAPDSEFEGVSAKDKTFYPPYLFYANEIGDSDWFIGFGLNTPFGLGTKWGSDAPFNAAFRTSVTPLAPVDIVTETTLEIVKLAPVVAYRASGRFSVGFGPEYYDVRRVVYKGGSSDGAGNGWNYSLKGDGDGFGYVLSSLYQPTEDLRVGFAWHSGVTADLSGNAVMFPDNNGVPYTGKVSVDLNLPDTIALGVHYIISDSFSINFDLDQTMWSDYKSLNFKKSGGSALRDINKNYKDVLACRLGGQYRLDDKWTLRAGFHMEPTPVVEKTFDPRLPDADAKSITVGGGYDAGSYAINFAYMALFKADRNVDSDEPNPLIDSIFDGKYKNSVNLIALDATFRF